MSDPESPPPTPGHGSTPPPPPPRDGCLTLLLILVGIVLLLPGLCAVIFGVGSLTSSRYDQGLTPFIVIGLLVGFGGVMLIRAAIRGPRR